MHINTGWRWVTLGSPHSGLARLSLPLLDRADPVDAQQGAREVLEQVWRTAEGSRGGEARQQSGGEEVGEIAISCDAPVAVPDLFGLTAAARAVMLLAEEHHVGFQSAAPASASTAAGVLGYVIFVAEGGTTLAVMARVQGGGGGGTTAGVGGEEMSDGVGEWLWLLLLDTPEVAQARASFDTNVCPSSLVMP